MDKKTLKALKSSIRHWEKNVAASHALQARTGPEDCALCGLFNDNECKGCPVSERTNKKYCYGSPYWHADNALTDWWDDRDDPLAEREWRRAAQAELDFLKSLLPEGEGA